MDKGNLSRRKSASPERPLVLGIESSCDDTACSVLDGQGRVLSSVVSSQLAAHRPYGGVVPEIASREHLRNWPAVRAEALLQAGIPLQEIDVVAATRGPGLVGSLLVGLSVGKAIAFGLGKPFFGVHHLEGHLFSPFLIPGAPGALAGSSGGGAAGEGKDAETLATAKRANSRPEIRSPENKGTENRGAESAKTRNTGTQNSRAEPTHCGAARPVPQNFVGLVVSGGHTALYSVVQTQGAAPGALSRCQVETLCETRDDAMGECFDKVGKRLGLPFPGGPAVDRLAELVRLKKGRAVFKYDRRYGECSARNGGGRGSAELFFRTPRCGTSLDFSYSGLKTQAMVEIERLEGSGLHVNPGELLRLSQLEGTAGRQAAEASSQYNAIALLAAFRDAAVRQVLDRLRRYHDATPLVDLAVSGGVAANRALRRALTQWGEEQQIRVHLVPLAFCGDNAAMIAHAALRRFTRGEEGDPLATDAKSRLQVR